MNRDPYLLPNGRVLRYSFVGWLAAHYGRRMIKVWSRTLDHWSAPILWTFVILTVAGIVYSIWKIKRTNRLSPSHHTLHPKHAD